MAFADNFDFNDWINDEQDVALVANSHLFENGEDLFGNAPGDSNLFGQTFDFPQDTTGFSTQGVNGDSYVNHTASNPSVEPQGVGGTIFNDSVDPNLLNVGDDFFILKPAVPATSAVNPDAMLDYYLGVAVDPLQDTQTAEQQHPLQDALTVEQQQQQWETSAIESMQQHPLQDALTVEQQQQQWETSAIESMQPFLELQSELQPDALVKDWLTNQTQAELSSQQIQGPQAHDNDIAGAAMQPLHTAEPVDLQILLQPTQTNSPIEDASSSDVPLPSKSRTKRTTRRARIPAERDSGLTASEDAIPGLSFSSLHDAEIAMTSRQMEYDWELPTLDDSIPTTKTERSRYVLNLLAAFQDTSSCKENKNGSSFLKRWLPADYYNVQDIEKVCWHIVSVAERLHSEGPSALNIYCAEAQRKVHASRLLYFNERIEAICDCLKFSKSICDNLMKADGIETLVGSPKLRMSGARTMLHQNAKRQQWMTQGRNEDPTHVPTRPGRRSGAVQAPVQVEGAATLKRKRKTKQPKQPKGAAKSQPEPIAEEPEPIASTHIGTSPDASLPNTTPSQPTAPANGYGPAQTRAPSQITIPLQSAAPVNEPSELLRQTSAGLQSSFEKSPTTSAPASSPSQLSQPSEPSVAPKPSKPVRKPVRSHPTPVVFDALTEELSDASTEELSDASTEELSDALTEDSPARSSTPEPTQSVRKPRTKVSRELRALYADADHSKAVLEAQNLSRTKRAIKAITDKAPKTKECLKSVDEYDSEPEEQALSRELRALYADADHSKVVSEAHNLSRTKRATKAITVDEYDSESEEQARPTKRQRKTGESVPSKKPESDIARRRRLQAKKNASELRDYYASIASDLGSDDDSSDDDASDSSSSDDDNTVDEREPTTAVKPATRFPPPQVKPKASAAPKSTAPVSKKRKTIPDADPEDEAETPRHAKRTKTSSTAARKYAPAKPVPIKKGKALRKKAASTTDKTRKSAPAKPAPVKKRKAMRKIPVTEDSDNSDDEFIPDSDDDSGSGSDSDSGSDSGSDSYSGSDSDE